MEPELISEKTWSRSQEIKKSAPHPWLYEHDVVMVAHSSSCAWDPISNQDTRQNIFTDKSFINQWRLVEGGNRGSCLPLEFCPFCLPLGFHLLLPFAWIPRRKGANKKENQKLYLIHQLHEFTIIIQLQGLTERTV